MPEALVGHTLSSTAERAYWLGRYLARVENTASLTQSFTNLLIDLPLRAPTLWSTLVEITGTLPEFQAHFEDPSERNICRWILNDQRHSAALLESVTRARENARTLQGVIPRLAYEYVNELHLLCRDQLAEPLSRSRRTDALAEAIEIVQRTDGFLSGNMLHDDIWRFYRLGVFLERADMVTRIIDLGASTDFGSLTELEAFDELRWRMVLRSRSAVQTYRRCYEEPIGLATVLDFFLCNEELPSSLQYCVKAITQSLRALPRPDSSLRALGPLRRALKQLDVDTITEEEASEKIDEWQRQLGVVHDKIARTYFDPARRSDDKALSAVGSVRQASKQ